MIKYLKNKHTQVFYKVLNNEVLQVTNEDLIFGISVISRVTKLFQDIFEGDIMAAEPDEFITAYSEVKRKLMNHDLLQDEEQEIYLSDVFKEWAERYFSERSGIDVIKEEALAAMKAHSPQILGFMTSNGFKKQLKAWSKLNGYSFDDRIMKLIQGKTTEHIRVKKNH